MPHARTKLRAGQARVEFLANKEKVFELLDKGHSITSVYEQFVESNAFNMAYSTFFGLLNKNQNSKKKTKPATPPALTTETVPTPKEATAPPKADVSLAQDKPKQKHEKKEIGNNDAGSFGKKTLSVDELIHGTTDNTTDATTNNQEESSHGKD